MTQTVIFQPMAALVAWTFTVLLLMPFHAFRAARQKEDRARFRATGRFEGGSVMGDGVCVKKPGSPGGITAKLGGYIRVWAEGLDDARSFLPGNPVFEAGGTVEIRELPRSDA
jgi:hypothetical protein